MDDYQKFALEYSDRVVAAAEKEQVKKEHHENRFNYFNCVISVLALILSIISIILGLN